MEKTFSYICLRLGGWGGKSKLSRIFHDFKSPDASATTVTNIDLYLTGQNNSVSSSFSNSFLMIMICEGSSVMIRAYIYIYMFFFISLKMNIGELLTNTSMFI